MTVRLPARMPAAVYHAPGDLRIEERPVPEPGPRDVLIEVSHCGICGTDLHLVLEGMGRPGAVGGHEYSGTIVARGVEVDERWALGTRVVGGDAPSCGRCRACRAGRASLCARLAHPLEEGGAELGAFAPYKRLPADRLHRVPEELPLRVAALTEPLAVALHAVTVSGAEPGQRALVTGAGPIGTLVLAALRARGVDDVTVTEPAPARRAQAERIGARRVRAPEALAIPAMPFTIVDEPFDVAFECSGRPQPAEAALAQLGRLGRLVFVGTGMRRPRLDVNRVLLNELEITGAYNYDAGGFEAALALLAEGALPVEDLIAPGEFALEETLETMRALARGALAGKAMIAPRGNRA